MKLVILVVLLISILAVSVCATTFVEGFEDGDTDGWLSASPNANGILGNWRPLDNMLTQDLGGDGYKFLVDNLSISSQSVEINLYLFEPAGYGGITVWYQDCNNWVDVAFYPGNGRITMNQMNKGTFQEFWVPYSFPKWEWHTLRVDADGITGELAIYRNGTYLLTHQTNVDYRTGLTGVNSGNSGGYFDDFKLTYTADSIPEPSSCLALFSGIVTLGYLRRRR